MDTCRGQRSEDVEYGEGKEEDMKEGMQRVSEMKADDLLLRPLKNKQFNTIYWKESIS